MAIVNGNIKQIDLGASSFEMLRTNNTLYIDKSLFIEHFLNSLETDEQQLTLSDLYQKLAIAEKQIKNGDLIDGEEAFSKLRAKY